jgi:predicted dehydrogenase
MAAPGHVLQANRASVLSPGTERMAADLARRSLVGKAFNRPDQVRRAVEKLRQEGLVTTLTQINARLDDPLVLGYACAGVVLEVGRGVTAFKPGDRVASNGPHGDLVLVPQHLCARIPDTVPFAHAAFGILGAIALQGVRLCRTSVGETVFVIGLGLVGQLTVGLLRAAGARVFATDLDAGRCQLAGRMGALEARPFFSARDVEAMTAGRGADGVIVAVATDSRAPMDLAVAAVRKKGRIVLVGVAGLELDRRPYYFKECEFVVSSSYGPGRYDPEYEERGHDYPAAYVRWTEQRNLESVLDLMGRGQLDVSPLISHRFPIADAERAYELIENDGKAFMGVVLEYPTTEVPNRAVVLSAEPAPGPLGLGVLGAGLHARSTLFPLLKLVPELSPRVLCSAHGLSAATAGKAHGFARATSDERDVLQAPDVHALLVLTRHNEHARQAAEGLRAGKHVFVEKPLALAVEEIDMLDAALVVVPHRILMVGFNRRFSPAAARVRAFFQTTSEPLTVSVRFNAGMIPPEHWTQSLEEGGGRIVGEACHGIDLATFLVGSPPVRVYAEAIGGEAARPPVTDDQCFITLRHANGSVSSVAYLAGGDRACGKERVEVLGGGRMAIIDDFRSVTTAAHGRVRTRKSWNQDKGHGAGLQAFAAAAGRGGPMPIPWPELRAVSLAAILAVRSLREGVAFEVPQV